MNTPDLPTHTRRFPALKAGFLVLFVLLLAGSALTYVWAQKFDDRIGQNVLVAGVNVSNMDPESARIKIQSRVDELLTGGVPVRAGDVSGTLALANVVGGDSIEIAQFQVQTAVEMAFDVRHRKNPLLDIFSLVHGQYSETSLDIPVTLQKEKVEAALIDLFGKAPVPPREPSFRYTQTAAGVEVALDPGQTGKTYEVEAFVRELDRRLEQLDSRALELTLVVKQPSFEVQDAPHAATLAQHALQSAPWKIVEKNKDVVKNTWTLTETDLRRLLIPSSENDGSLQMNPKEWEAFMEPIAARIDREAQDAKFSFQAGARADFTASREGRKVDVAKSQQAVLDALQQNERADIALVIETVKPRVTLAEVNTLGITTPLGIGTSLYRGSPANRIKNIRNGVRLLNGIIIAPDETFSLLRALEPFTAENGYLPELVIRGNEIKPELGGGLCQIGTTTFRATMNAGLPVLDRRNHSIVVSYYNDLANGNPGTDATIYDPAPDYKFKNDTGRVILFQAEMLEDVGELRFSFWGTSDGRRGSYNAPVVTEWFPVGEPQRIETTKLAVGEESCQSAHIGADANFTYTVILPDGTKTDRLFESHYRPLPKMCLVGVEKITSEDKIYSDRPEGLSVTE